MSLARSQYVLVLILALACTERRKQPAADGAASALTGPAPAASHVPVFEGRDGFVATQLDHPPIERRLGPGHGSASPFQSLVVKAASPRPGERVAEIGCGPGIHTFLLADAVGPQGRVFARDINRSYVDRLKKKASARAYTNIDAALSRKDDVGLLDASIDVALFADVYHVVLKEQASTKSAFLRSLHRAMKPGGVVIVAHVLASETSERLLRKTLADFVAQGFAPGRRWSILPGPHFLVEFRRPPARSPT